MLAKKKPKPKPKTAARGFGAPSQDAVLSPQQSTVIASARKLRRSQDAAQWLRCAGAAAEIGEYAEARQLLESGLAHCSEGNSLRAALGQMTRTPPTEEVAQASAAIEWPGKGDHSAYDPSAHSFRRYSTPQPPPVCARGTTHASGEAIVCVSDTPILPPDECAWVVEAAERAAGKQWKVDPKEWPLTILEYLATRRDFT
jgi:hypothetical protein